MTAGLPGEAGYLESVWFMGIVWSQRFNRPAWPGKPLSIDPRRVR